MRLTPLADICDIEMGQAPVGSSYNHDGEGYPLLAGAGDFGIDSPIATKYTTQPTKISQPGDVLLCIRATVGDLNWSDKAYCLGRGVAGLRPRNGKLDRRYLWRCMEHVRPELEKLGRGSTFLQVSRRDIAELAIPLPSDLREQRRIAAILDKADAVRSKRQQALVLADAFLRSVFLGMFGRPKQPNPALRTRPLGEICSLFAGNSLPAGEPYSGQVDGHLLLKVGDLNLPGNDQTVLSAREWLSTKARTGAAIVAPKDAIVFPKRGGAIATNKKRVLGRSCILDPNLMAVAPKPDSPVSYPYLRVWFELLDLASISNGSTVPQLNKGDLYPLEMSIPDKNSLFVFDQLFHGVNRVRAKHADDLMSAEALFSSLSQRAFRGEL